MTEKEDIKNEDEPNSSPQNDFQADNSTETNQETEAAESGAKSEGGLIESLTGIADAVLERIEPVLAPVEEAIKENIVEPVLDVVMPETPPLEPVSSGENRRFSQAAETSVLTKAQPYEVQEIDSPETPGAEKAKDARAIAEEIPEEEQLDVLGVEALPALPQINRARLQVQSPNRIFLYWSLAGNPFATLHRAFGNRAANYSLVLKLKNLTDGGERIFPVGRDGNWWFDVQPNGNFRVDVGLFAQNRPFIRLISSNAVQTPRSAPSSRVDTESDWQISRVQFARVLDVSGYTHDALPVVFGFGEDGVFDEAATLAVLNQIASNAPATAETFDADEMRLALSALAAGVSYETLRDQLSPALQAWFESVMQQEPDALRSEKVLAAMQAVLGDQFVEDFAGFGDETGRRISLEPVFGASAVHFPEIVLPRIFQKLPENLFSGSHNFPTSPALR